MRILRTASIFILLVSGFSLHAQVDSEALSELAAKSISANWNGDGDTQIRYEIFQDFSMTEPSIVYTGQTTKRGEKVYYRMGPLISIYDGLNLMTLDDSAKTIFISSSSGNAHYGMTADLDAWADMCTAANKTVMDADEVVYSMLLDIRKSPDVARVDVYTSADRLTRIDVFYRSSTNIGSAFEPMYGTPKMSVHFEEVTSSKDYALSGLFDISFYIREHSGEWRPTEPYTEFEIILQ